MTDITENYRSKYQGGRRYTVEEVRVDTRQQTILYRTDDRERARKYRQNKSTFGPEFRTVIVDQVTKEIF